jgi:hypothetical protein
VADTTNSQQESATPLTYTADFINAEAPLDVHEAGRTKKVKDARKSNNQLLQDFYSKYNPNNLHAVDSLLDQYKDDLNQLVIEIKMKYGAAPALTALAHQPLGLAPTFSTVSAGAPHSATSTFERMGNEQSAKNSLRPGQIVYVRDEFKSKKTGRMVSKWRRSEIIKINSRTEIEVHFCGWHASWNEVIDLAKDLNHKVRLHEADVHEMGYEVANDGKCGEMRSIGKDIAPEPAHVEQERKQYGSVADCLADMILPVPGSPSVFRI